MFVEYDFLLIGYLLINLLFIKNIS